MSVRRISFYLGWILFLSQWAHGQEMVKEEVSVNWWIVPLFAIDRGENPVLNLTNADVALLVDGRAITDFQIAKQNVVGSTVVAKGQPAPVPAVRKVAFLIFDVALSGHQTISNSKLIAKDILQNADPEIRFGIVVIDAVRGLELISSPQSDRKALLDMLETKVIPNPNSAPYYKMQVIVDADKAINPEGKAQKKYTPAEIEWFAEQFSRTYIPKINNFFESFESFYYLVAGIQEKKIFYLFSQGLTNDGMELISKDLFVRRIQETADFLNRAGGIVFIVDSVSVLQSAGDPASGEHSLRLMADESGGKYLRGETQRIAERIVNFNRAFYEIAFPAPRTREASSLHVKIKSNRRGLEIYSPSLLALPKAMVDMNEYEVEVLIQQCLRGTLPLNGGYTLYREGIVFQGLYGEGGQKAVSLRLPQPLLDRELDAFWIGYDASGRVLRMDKGTVKTGKGFVTLALPEAKAGAAKTIDLKLVILDIQGNAALLCDDAVAVN